MRIRSNSSHPVDIRIGITEHDTNRFEHKERRLEAFKAILDNPFQAMVEVNTAHTNNRGPTVKKNQLWYANAHLHANLGYSRGALIPSDSLMDEADAGRIHSMISDQPRDPVIDMKTGDPALSSKPDDDFGDTVFIGGKMRRFIKETDGTFLNDTVSRPGKLAHMLSVGKGIPLSRSVVWGIARQSGHDPTIWQMIDGELVTWGGIRFNRLIAAYLVELTSDRWFSPSMTGVIGPTFPVQISIGAIREWASQTE